MRRSGGVGRENQAPVGRDRQALERRRTTHDAGVHDVDRHVRGLASGVHHRDRRGLLVDGARAGITQSRAGTVPPIDVVAPNAVLRAPKRLNVSATIGTWLSDCTWSEYSELAGTSRQPRLQPGATPDLHPADLTRGDRHHDRRHDRLRSEQREHVDGRVGFAHVRDRDPLRSPPEHFAVGEPPLARRRERAERARRPGRSGCRAELKRLRRDHASDSCVHLHRDARLAHGLILHRDNDAGTAGHVDPLQSGQLLQAGVGAKGHVDARVGGVGIVEHEPLRHAPHRGSGREVPVGARGVGARHEVEQRPRLRSGLHDDIGRERLDDQRARRERLRRSRSGAPARRS